MWCSAAVSHLKLLDRNLNAIKFLIPELAVDLWHQRAVSSFCMLYEIFLNVDHPVHTLLPSVYQPPRLTRNALGAHSCTFSSIRLNTSQYSRSFIPATTKLWNSLPSCVVESLELQKFKLGANAFLFGQPT